MLVLGSRLHQTPVMSLQTGTRIAHTMTPIIDPANLKIIAYEVEGPLLTERPSYLRTADIREMGGLGMIIDSSDELVVGDDILKIKEIRDLNFQLVGMAVIDEAKHKLGKIEDYTLETDSFVVQQLHIRRGFMRSLNDTGMLIHRSQIVEINDRFIVVKSGMKREKAKPVKAAVQNLEYVNPFREPAPQPEQREG